VSDPRQITNSPEEHAGGGTLGGTLTGSRRRWRAAVDSSPHAPRFRLVTAILVGFAVGASLVAVAIGAGGRREQHSVAWSSWSPADSGTLGARDIADYIAPFYRISAVDQLAVVTVVNLESATAAAQAAAASANGTSSSAGSGLQVAVKPNPASSAVSLLSGNTIGFDLCGIGGKNCAIGVGQPSSSRLLLLRREALELALYTFKYLGGVQNVVAILPPAHQMQTSELTKSPPKTDAAASSKPINMAVLFVRQEIQPLLNRPLSDTLPEEIPPSVTQMASAPEAGLVDQVTARGLFSEQLQQAQDGSNLIVLDPLPPQ
jgi:hypothetical protein